MGAILQMTPEGNNFCTTKTFFFIFFFFKLKSDKSLIGCKGTTLNSVVQ